MRTGAAPLLCNPPLFSRAKTLFPNADSVLILYGTPKDSKKDQFSITLRGTEKWKQTHPIQRRLHHLLSHPLRLLRCVLRCSLQGLFHWLRCYSPSIGFHRGSGNGDPLGRLREHQSFSDFYSDNPDSETATFSLTCTNYLGRTRRRRVTSSGRTWTSARRRRFA